MAIFSLRFHAFYGLLSEASIQCSQRRSEMRSRRVDSQLGAYIGNTALARQPTTDVIEHGAQRESAARIASKLIDRILPIQAYSLNNSDAETAMQALPHNTAPNMPMQTFLRMPSVMRVTGLGRSTIYRMLAEQKFPRPVRVGERAVAWRQSDLDTWSEARPSTH